MENFLPCCQWSNNHVEPTVEKLQRVEKLNAGSVPGQGECVTQAITRPRTAQNTQFGRQRLRDYGKAAGIFSMTSRIDSHKELASGREINPFFHQIEETLLPQIQLFRESIVISIVVGYVALILKSGYYYLSNRV